MITSQNWKPSIFSSEIVSCGTHCNHSCRFPCVCSVIYHRWCQNAVRAKRWHVREGQVVPWFSWPILMFSMISHCTDPQQHRILFVLYDNQAKFVNDDNIYVPVPQLIMKKNQSKYVCNSIYDVKHYFLSSSWILFH